LDILDIVRRGLNTHLHKLGTARISLTAALVVTLGISALLTVTIAGSVANEPGASTASYYDILRSSSHLVPTPTPVRTPKPVPSPSPTRPLPPLLSQAIAKLQAKDRLLFNGNTSLPEIALTFDDGPNPYYTPLILDILKKYNVKATFFCIGRQVAAYPTLVKQEYMAGHLIGNHSWSHPDMALLAPANINLQLVSTSNAIQEATGVRPIYFRPPYGIMSVPVLTQAYHLGLTTVIWNDEARDWQLPGMNVIVERILGLARNGAIVLLHDGGGNRSQTVAALPYIIKGLRARGFQLVTIAQMMQDLHKRKIVATTSTTFANLAMQAGQESIAWRRKPVYML
jgi:peptidoglycan/xylan/chitin deacetylase (PgdA/CDA1 family)